MVLKQMKSEKELFPRFSNNANGSRKYELCFFCDIEKMSKDMSNNYYHEIILTTIKQNNRYWL